MSVGGSIMQYVEAKIFGTNRMIWFRCQMDRYHFLLLMLPKYLQQIFWFFCFFCATHVGHVGFLPELGWRFRSIIL